LHIFGFIGFCSLFSVPDFCKKSDEISAEKVSPESSTVGGTHNSASPTDYNQN
jgi:hypothetical protein